MPADFDAVCAQLSTPELCTVAQSEGIVWGQVKGYASWPAQVIAPSVAARDTMLAKHKPSKGTAHMAVQFFGDATKAWLNERSVVAWSEGCSKGFLQPKKENKTLPPAILEVHAFLQTGALPDGWWQKSSMLSPVKKTAAAETASDAAAVPKQQKAAAAKKTKPAATAVADAGQQQKKHQTSKAEAEVQQEVVDDVEVQATDVEQQAEPPVASSATEGAQVVAAAGLPLAAAVVVPAAAGPPLEMASTTTMVTAAVARDGMLGALLLPLVGGGAAATAAAAASAAARPAGSGSTSTRDMLRSAFNRIKLLHPAAARLETPNSVVDLLAALRKHFGPAMALATEQLRGKDANDLLSALFSWAAGKPIAPAEVERCFPLVPHGKVLMPYALWDRITELGLYPLHWQLPLAKGQVDQGQRDGVAGVPAPHSAPACRVAAPGTAVVAAVATVIPKKKRVAPAPELRSLSKLWPARAAPGQQMQELDGDYEPAPRPARRHSMLAVPSRFALESGGSKGGSAVAGAGGERAGSPSLTAEEAASSQRALAAGRGPGVPIVDGRIVKPRAGGGWPGLSLDGLSEEGVPELGGRNTLPSYVHVRQNVWVSRPRPKRLLRDDIPVCNCHAPVGPSISSRRAALEQQQLQRQPTQLAQWQQQAAQLAAEQQLLLLPPPPPSLPLPLAAPTAADTIPGPPPLAPQLAFQSASHPAPISIGAEAGTEDAAAAALAGGSPNSGSAKKRVRRTDWEGRKCDWCGVTETSNWRRHPDNRDMLLCNQCGGYVRKHGKLSQERRDRVAAQQVAVAMASVVGQASQPLGANAPSAGRGTSALGVSMSNGTVLPLFQAAPVTMPPPPTMPMAHLPWSLQQQDAVWQQQPASMDVDHAAEEVEEAAGAEREVSAAAEDVQVDAAEQSQGQEPGAKARTAETAQQEQQQQQPPELEPEDAAAAAALVAALFAPWQEEMAANREERRALAALLDVVFAPFLAQQQAVEPKLEPLVNFAATDALQQPVVAVVKQQTSAESKEQLGAMVTAFAVPQPVGTQQRSATAALAVAVSAPPPPTRTGSGSLRRATAAPAVAPAAPQVGCGDSCLNRLSFITCDRSTCPCGERCTNRPFVELAQPSMEVYLTPDKGWGVRAAAFVPRGTFIVEYAGEVIDDKECSRRAEDAKARNEPHFYMMEMAPGLIIDARNKGNLARLLNSSCDPNCETQKWHDAGNSEVRVGIFSLRDILPGEELTYDYQFQHFGLAAAAGAYRCKCGAPNCRGTMDTQPERTRDYGRRLDVWWPTERRYFRGTITAYSSSQQRHTVKYDDGDQGRMYLPVEKYRWVDEHGHVVGDTHEPEAGAVAVGRGGGGCGKKRSGCGSNASAGAKRHKRPTTEQLNGGSAGGSSASDLGSADGAGELGLAAGLHASLATGPPPAADEAAPMGAAEPAALLQQQGAAVAAELPSISPRQQLGTVPVGVSFQKASPDMVLDTYTHFNLAQQQPGVGVKSAATWALPPLINGVVPHLDIPGLPVNAMPSSLLPPPTQAGTLPEAPPLNTTSPLAASADAPAFNPFGGLCLGGLTMEQQQAISALGQALGSPKAMAAAAHLQLNSSGGLVKQEGEQHEVSLADTPSATAAAPAVPPLQLQPVAGSALHPVSEGGQLQVCDPALQPISGAIGHRQLRDPSLKPISGIIGHRRGRGGSQPMLADVEAARPRRTVRRPARRFDDDDEGPQEVDSDEDYVPSDHDEPASPPRTSAASRARAAVAATLSPTTQAAVTMAMLLGGGQTGLPGVLPAAVRVAAVKKEDSEEGEDDVEKDPDVTPEGLSTRSTQRRQPQAPLPVHVPATAAAPPGAPRGSGNRRNAPTPASTGLPARTILVAKRLTNSDVSKGRILLPRAAVEANLSFAIGKAHSLIARDHQQQTWEFTLQSWANGSRAGMESRRVYVLEHAGDFVRAHTLKPDDVIGLSTSDEGAFLVEYNTEEVLAASENLAGARFGQPAPIPAAGSVRPAANMLIQQNAGRCMRSEHCTKPAGHPGFCVRTHAAAAAAAARKARQANAAAAAAVHSSPEPAVATAPSTENGPARAAAIVGTSRAGAPRVLGGGGAFSSAELSGAKRAHEAQLFEGDHGPDGRPKRMRKPTEKVASLEDSDDDYLAAAAATADAIAEAAADSDMSDDDAEPPLMHPTFFQLKAKPPSGGLPPPQPPVPGPNVPPIFVMAPDPAAAAAAAAPPQLRSPLHPSLSMQHMASMHSSGSLPLPLHHSNSGPLHLGGGQLHPHPLHPHHHHHAHPHHHHVPHSQAAPMLPSHPPVSLPLGPGLGAPVVPPVSLPLALPLSMPGVLPSFSAPMSAPAPPAPTAGRAGATPPPAVQQQQMQEAAAASQGATPGPTAVDTTDYLAGSPEDERKQQQQPNQAVQQPPRAPPLPGLHTVRPALAAGPGQQVPRPVPGPGQLPARPLMRPGIQPPPRPGMQQQPLRPGMQQQQPWPGMQQPFSRPMMGAPLPRPGAPPPRPLSGPLASLPQPGTQQVLPRPMLGQLPRPGVGPPRPLMPGPGGPKLPPRPMMLGAARPPPPAAVGVKVPGALGQARPPPPLLASGGYLQPRPAGVFAPPPLFGGAPPAVAPGVGFPPHLPHHHHHHHMHMPPLPPQPEFDVGTFLSSAD